MSKLKIAYLLGSLNRGGTEILLLDTLKNLKGSGIEAICIYRYDGTLSEEFNATGVKMISIKTENRFDFLYIIKLRRIIKKHKIEIAHAQQPLDALYAYLSCLGLKTKIVLTIHGYDFDYTKQLKRILNFIQKRITLNIFVSQSQKAYYQTKYSFKDSANRVLYNGISFDKFNNIKKASIRNEFNIPDSHILLGSVGNFNPGRDQLTICRFLNLLHRKGIPFSFIFAGIQSKAAPQYWIDCIKYCQEKGLSDIVHFPGSRSDIPNLLSQLDAFIYSTEHDTFGIAIIEAISMGLPVFVNDWGVMIEITGNGKHAILYQTKNEQDLLNKFIEFIDHKEVYIEKAKMDAVWAKKKYSIQKHLQNLEIMYSEIN